MGGAGSAVSELLNEEGFYLPIKHFGVKDYYPEHGEREEILAEYGLTAGNLIQETEQFLKKAIH